MQSTQQRSRKVGERTVFATIDTAWFKNRLRDLDISQADLARHLEIDPGAVSLMLRGMRRITMEEATKISGFLNQPLAEVVTRAGIQGQSHVRSNEVPLIGDIDGSGEVHMLPTSDRTVSRPSEISDGVVAVLYRTAMTPRDLYDGWTLYYRPTKILDPECVGRLAIAQLANGGPIVVRFARRGYAPKTLNLVNCITPEASIENARVDWAAPILWIKP